MSADDCSSSSHDQQNELGPEDSPPPNEGVLRQVSVEDSNIGVFVDADTHIVCNVEDYRRLLNAGKHVILTLPPGPRPDPLEVLA